MPESICGKTEYKTNINQGNNICKYHSETFPLSHSCVLFTTGNSCFLLVHSNAHIHTYAVPQGEQWSTGEWLYDGHPKTTEASAQSLGARWDAGGFEDSSDARVQEAQAVWLL